jgi:hypothetical protein
MERAIRGTGKIWNICPGFRGSFRLGTGELDHITPLLGFVGDELAEIGGRTGQRRLIAEGMEKWVG